MPSDPKDTLDKVVLPQSSKDIPLTLPNESQVHALNKDILPNDFLPKEIELLSHAGKDVIKRLLVVDPKQRIRSVLSLQKIALYKNFKIETDHLLSVSLFYI